ncbi:DUF1572 family protein [Aureibacillus halotolerans]|uniref:Putative damage-inducible protein DinB n=1 Tax=Aureibacillus halotolerans TaxID=1508390 RepID=A0A4R6U482_9BACI|nr:DUF1572 family protein [Aureibacillus halotolerans]TDQ41260.1 putative damage-inducible protein DinB [Aureibacillus halotolerans]
MLSYDLNREWLISKFEEIQYRILKAIEQLDDDQLNWRPDDLSHSISNLIKHIEGNTNEKIKNGILGGTVARNRDDEFKHTYISKTELIKMVTTSFPLVIDTVRTMPEQTFEQRQLVRNKEVTNLDVLLQCTAHFSEHTGQILYIAKMCLKNQYISTSF